MTQMDYIEQSKKLAGPIALAKLKATRVAHNIADEACQIFGGRGITKTGMGALVEKWQVCLQILIYSSISNHVIYFFAMSM